MSDPTYRLLLELAGRVDDDLLATGRELVAVGEEGHALELLVAELVAGRVELPGAVRLELVAEAAARRVQPDADRCLPRDTGAGVPDPQHRFVADGPGGAQIAAAVATVPELVDGALTWRTTPAGSAPGALPHPVLLAGAGDGGSAEVVTYQGQAALTRAGLVASVEVRGGDDPQTGYHRAAWTASVPVRSLLSGAPVSPASAGSSASAGLSPPAGSDRGTSRTAEPGVVPTSGPGGGSALPSEQGSSVQGSSVQGSSVPGPAPVATGATVPPGGVAAGGRPAPERPAGPAAGGAATAGPTSTGSTAFGSTASGSAAPGSTAPGSTAVASPDAASVTTAFPAASAAPAPPTGPHPDDAPGGQRRPAPDPDGSSDRPRPRGTPAVSRTALAPRTPADGSGPSPGPREPDAPATTGADQVDQAVGADQAAGAGGARALPADGSSPSGSGVRSAGSDDTPDGSLPRSEPSDEPSHEPWSGPSDHGTDPAGIRRAGPAPTPRTSPGGGAPTTAGPRPAADDPPVPDDAADPRDATERADVPRDPADTDESGDTDGSGDRDDRDGSGPAHREPTPGPVPAAPAGRLTDAPTSPGTVPTPGTPPTAGTPQIGRTGQTPVVTNGTGPRADAYHTDRVPRPGELPRTVAAPPPGTGPVAVPAGDLPASTGAGPAPGAGTFDGGPVTSPVPSGADPSPGEPVHPAPRPSPPIRALRGDTGPMPVTSEWFAPPSDSGAPQDTVPATPQPPPDDDATPHPPVAGSPAVPSPDEDAWAQDWASGAWAGAVLTPEPEAAQAGPQAPVANPDGADADAPTPPPGVPIVHAPAPPQDTTTGGRRPRHLLLDEDPAPHATGTGGTPDAAAETPQPQAPAPGGPTASPRPQPRPGPAPGSVADRLSTTEQQLLARLHEELEARESGGEPTPRNGTARRPRPGPA